MPENKNSTLYDPLSIHDDDPALQSFVQATLIHKDLSDQDARVILIAVRGDSTLVVKELTTPTTIEMTLTPSTTSSWQVSSFSSDIDNDGSPREYVAGRDLNDIAGLEAGYEGTNKKLTVSQIHSLLKANRIIQAVNKINPKKGDELSATNIHEITQLAEDEVLDDKRIYEILGESESALSLTPASLERLNCQLMDNVMLHDQMDHLDQFVVDLSNDSSPEMEQKNEKLQESKDAAAYLESIKKNHSTIYHTAVTVLYISAFADLPFSYFTYKIAMESLGLMLDKAVQPFGLSAESFYLGVVIAALIGSVANAFTDVTAISSGDADEFFENYYKLKQIKGCFKKTIAFVLSMIFLLGSLVLSLPDFELPQDLHKNGHISSNFMYSLTGGFVAFGLIYYIALSLVDFLESGLGVYDYLGQMKRSLCDQGQTRKVKIGMVALLEGVFSFFSNLFFITFLSTIRASMSVFLAARYSVPLSLGWIGAGMVFIIAMLSRFNYINPYKSLYYYAASDYFNFKLFQEKFASCIPSQYNYLINSTSNNLLMGVDLVFKPLMFAFTVYAFCTSEWLKKAHFSLNSTLDFYALSLAVVSGIVSFAIEYYMRYRHNEACAFTLIRKGIDQFKQVEQVQNAKENGQEKEMCVAEQDKSCCSKQLMASYLGIAVMSVASVVRKLLLMITWPLLQTPYLTTFCRMQLARLPMYVLAFYAKETVGAVFPKFSDSTIFYFALMAGFAVDFVEFAYMWPKVTNTVLPLAEESTLLWQQLSQTFFGCLQNQKQTVDGYISASGCWSSVTSMFGGLAESTRGQSFSVEVTDSLAVASQ